MSDLLSEVTREQNAMQSITPWMQTLRGNAFDFEDLDRNIFDPVEVATALSRIPRFGGHTQWPYSVSQHSVLVARNLSGCHDRVRLAGLLHDVAESYIGDMINPLKHYLKSYGDNSYATLENRILSWLSRVHKLQSTTIHHDAIRHQDLRALATEKRDLMFDSPRPWVELPSPWQERIEPWCESYARDEWLRAYRGLV